MNISDFLYNYKLLNDDFLNYFPELSFENSIYYKKEFNKLILPKYEPKPSPGELLNHQMIIQRFLSSYTPYDELLLYHEVGTGKTCSSVGAIEQIRNENFGFKKALILVKGKPLIDNFINELVFVCTNGKYIPSDYENLTDMEKTIRTKKMLEDFYEFNTFEIFAKKISTLKDSQIHNAYNNSIIIIDEVHNLRPSDSTKEDKSIYNQIHRFLHILSNRKILLMSATPMKDKSEEIATVMNLILPSNKQLPIEGRFAERYLSDDEIKVPKRSRINELSEYFKGRVSYVKAQQTDIEKVYKGRKIKGLKHLNVFEDEMSDFQSEIYKKALKQDVGDEESIRKGIYNNSRQASLMVFPDESYGNEAYRKYIKEEKRMVEKDKFTYNFVLTREFKEEFEGKNTEEKLDILKRYSIKYAEIIRLLLDSEGENSFIYIDLVEGSGSVIFSKLLELFGFTKASGNEKTEGNRYALITTKTVTNKMIKSIIKTYNSPNNVHGKLIRVIIGSRMISEGITLKNVQNIHIVTPFWNYGDIDQAIGRGIRAFSHNDLKNELPEGETVKINVYHHVALPESGKSIDLTMYKISEKKDISIKAMEYLIKIFAVDCQLTKLRNYRDGRDGSRECEYKECDYECDGITFNEYMEDITDSYYNLYFKKDMLVLKDKLINELATKFILSFDRIKELLPEYTEYELLTTLNNLISTKELIICTNGLRGFLFKDDNVFYISEKIYSKSYLDNYYINTPTFYTHDNFKNIIKNELLDNIDSLIEELTLTDNDNVRRIIINKLPLNIQEMFVEAAILANKRAINVNKDLQEFILSHFKEFIKEIDEIIISILPEKENKTLRCLNGYKWNDCDDDIKEKLKKQKSEIEEKLITNKYGYYGIYNKGNNKFLIRDVTNKEFTETEDTREKTRGKACKSWKRDELLKVALKLKLRVLDESLINMSKSKLITLANTPKLKKKLEKLIDIETLINYTTDEVRRIIYFGRLSVNELCTDIYEFFRLNNLLLIE